MTRNECIHALNEEYKARRLLNETEADARFEEAAARDPMIRQLREENSMLALDTLKRIAQVEDDERRRALAQDMRDRGKANNAEIANRLIALGYAEDHLAVRYRCNVCRDTGLVGDAPARFCDCFERALRLMIYEDGSMADARKECFERFDANRIPEEDGQRAAMISLRNVCEAYANDFPNTRFQNLILTGAGGLGKTFMLNSIYARVVERGGEAIRITAYRMFETMRAHYFSDAADKDEFEQLINVPLLLIDDLGTEPMMRNITVESLFILLNERAQNDRHTVISTNFSPLQVNEKYGERVMSRMFDKTRGATILLKGKDLRKL